MSENKSPTAEIWEAISSGDIDQTRSLFLRHPDMINAFIPFGGGTFLHLASSKQGPDMISEMIKLGFDVNKAGRVAGDTALVSACSYGNYYAAKYLLDHGADMDVDSPDNNPLFASIIGGSIHIAKLLIEKGIDSKINYTGYSMKNMDAIAFALERGERSIAEMIADLNSGGDINRAKEIIEQALEVAQINNRKK